MQTEFSQYTNNERVPVRLSHWVNEPYPPISELLSAHEVARLTRRPRFVLWGLALIGRFPRKARYRSRTFGWRRSDVLDWLARGMALQDEHPSAAMNRQRDLPLHNRNRNTAIRPHVSKALS